MFNILSRRENVLPELSGNKNNHDEVYLKKLMADSANSLEVILKKLPSTFTVRLACDIGAGFGTYAINLALKGIKTIAVEPSMRERDVISLIVGKNPKSKKFLKVIDGRAEKLNLASNSFDLCLLSQVLEHVDNPNHAMREVSRILKPGGYLHLGSPNYIFPMEQHYGIWYFPMIPKKILQFWILFWLKLKGQNLKENSLKEIKEFVESINYTTDKMIVGLCQKNNLKIIWSQRESQKNILGQICTHWKQNPSFIQVLLILISLPKKLIRSLLVIIGILPMKLEYLIVKN